MNLGSARENCASCAIYQVHGEEGICLILLFKQGIPAEINDKSQIDSRGAP